MDYSGRPDYAVPLAVVGVLAAIGIPSLERGNLLVGCACISAAAAALTWAAVRLWRARR